MPKRVLTGILIDGINYIYFCERKINGEPAEMKNETAKRYLEKIDKLLKREDLNDVERNFSMQWKRRSNLSLKQRRAIDSWLEKYGMEGAEKHNFKPWVVNKQSGGGYRLEHLIDGAGELVLGDLTKKDADILSIYLNDYGEEILKKGR